MLRICKICDVPAVIAVRRDATLAGSLINALIDVYKRQSLGGIVASRSVRMAGDMFDQAIIAFIKRKYNLLIGERTAEQIKIEIGSAYPMDPEMTLEIKGRNLVDGLPKNVVVHSEDVREALLAVSYTHLDVYKRQVRRCRTSGPRCRRR